MESTLNFANDGMETSPQTYLMKSLLSFFKIMIKLETVPLESVFLQ